MRGRPGVQCLIGNKSSITSWILRLHGKLVIRAATQERRLIPIHTCLRNVEKVIIAAYGWLADNYKEGDKIFLFGSHLLIYMYRVASNNYATGFSRGAYQVRAIAGMIETVRDRKFSWRFRLTISIIKIGLIFSGNREQIPL